MNSRLGFWLLIGSFLSHEWALFPLPMLFVDADSGELIDGHRLELTPDVAEERLLHGVDVEVQLSLCRNGRHPGDGAVAVVQVGNLIGQPAVAAPTMPWP